MIEAGQEYPIKLLAASGVLGAALVLCVEGDAAQYELALAGTALGDWGVQGAPGPGLWLWSGTIVYSSVDPNDDGCEPSFDGEWRRATADEAARFAAGECIWA